SGAGPPLLLVSGLNGTARFWRLQVPRLAERFTVVVHDHRGVDRSSRDGIDRAAMVGQSTGGAIGQHIAATYPQRISRLVLSSTWTHADAYFRRLFELRRDLLRDAGLELYTREGS